MDNGITINRIIVEQEADWLRVQDNLAKGMIESMETRLSSLPGGKDGSAAKGVRKELEARLAKIREEVFQLVKPNLRINGYNYEDYVPATEAFDEDLDRGITALNAERVSYETLIAGKRRTVPGIIHRAEQGLENWRELAEWVPADEVEAAPVKQGEVPPPPRHQETKEVFNVVAANLTEINNTAMQLQARAQRAQSVREEIANLGS